ncbi:MAG: glycosyltransferase [Bacteroidales bacterium]|nr:glycosyltransferase [Bacteroidales bacterium]
MNRVLIITYYWPPSGGAGVQRWLKFSKYLPQFGWEPYILTVDPEYASYPAFDASLERDIPESIKVFRTKATDWFRFYGNDKSKVPSAGFAKNKDDSFRGKILRFIRGNFFIPDPRRGWNRFAFRKASELIKKEKIKHIITTSPPHSSQLIGLKLKKRYPEIKWMADLRDPWTDIYYYELFYPTFISRRIDLYYERSVLNNADVITTVGPSLGKYFESKTAGTGNKIRIIHNGYDESDFENVTAVIPGRFTISFTGTISESYPLEGFIKALKTLIEKGNNIALKITGLISEGQKEQLITSVGNNHLEFIPYSDHKTAIGQMLSSSLQLLVIAKHPGNKSFLSGKIFEYIASGMPVLCLGPVDGDAAQILESNGYGKCFEYEDEEGIAGFILETINQPPVISKMPPSEFSRRNLAGLIASLL